MKLTLSGHPTGLKIDKEDKVFIGLELPVDGLDLQQILPFVKKDCNLRILSSTRDLNTQGYIEELALKAKLKLKVRCTEGVDLNIINQLIADPETTSIVFNDGQASLKDYEVKVEHHGKNEVGGIAAEMINTYGLDGAKKVLEVAKKEKAAARRFCG